MTRAIDSAFVEAEKALLQLPSASIPYMDSFVFGATPHLCRIGVGCRNVTKAGHCVFVDTVKLGYRVGDIQASHPNGVVLASNPNLIVCCS
jgi:hypothetical protein